MTTALFEIHAETAAHLYLKFEHACKVQQNICRFITFYVAYKTHK